MRYRYATVFEALNDGKPPNDGIEEGDRILVAGKDDEHHVTYLKEDNGIGQINFEAVDRYDHGEMAPKEEVVDAAKEWWVSDGEDN